MKNFKHFVDFFKNKKKWQKAVLVLLVLIIIGAAGKALRDKYERSKFVAIGIVTDIHAGNQDTRTEGIESDNILHPSHFENNIKSALEKMKNCDFILTLGDNLNASSEKYASRLLEITKNYPMIWTKGNHDEDKMFQLFHQPKNYYYVDKGNWRIIVLDNGNIDHSKDYAKGDYIPRGYMEPEQIDWLKSVAFKTDKKIVVSMHVPIFDRFNLGSIYPDQEYLAKLFEENGNVKYVLSGHFHVNNWHKNINGIDYYIVPSLELEGNEGYFMILTLPN